MTEPLLELAHVTKRFGRVVIAEDLSFTVGPGDTVGIVGPNGAGKTSLFGLISGDLAPGDGRVSFAGRPVTKLDAAARCRLGIGRTYQVPRPFTDMTVFENVLVAAQQGAGLRRQASYTAAGEALERADMTGEANLPAARLGLLQRKRLELALALASRPSTPRRAWTPRSPTARRSANSTATATSWSAVWSRTCRLFTLIAATAKATSPIARRRGISIRRWRRRRRRPWPKWSNW